MKTTSFLAFVLLCSLAGNVGANDFSVTDVTSTTGVEVHFVPGWEPDKYIDKLNLIQAAGIHVIRTDFLWEAIESTKDNYDNISVYTPFVEACADRGIHIIATLDYANPLYGWNADHTTQYARTDPAYYGTQDFYTGFTNYANHVTTTFAQLTSDYNTGHPGANATMTWELWNEPNYGFWPGNNIDQYMALASTVLPQIRNTWDPNATIIAPAVSSFAGSVDPTDYLRGCFQATQYHDSLLNLVDGLSVHFYRNMNPETVVDDTAPTDYATYAKLHTLLKNENGQYGNWSDHSDMPIVSGEWGYPTHPSWGDGDITPQRQADYLQRMMLTNFGQGVSKVPYSIWYDFQDCGADPSSAEYDFGMFYDDLTPKPAYYAMKTLNKTLEGMSIIESSVNVNSTNPINHMTFTTGGSAPRLTLAAWTADGTNHGWNSVWCGTHLLTDTPLYVGEQWAWQGGPNGTWAGNNWENHWAWTDAGWQARIDETARIAINDGQAFTVSGLQLNAPNIQITGGDYNTGILRFTIGGGSINVNTGVYEACSIDAVIADADDNDPNNPASFVLRKYGAGTLNLGNANTVHGRLLIGQGGVQLYNPLAAQNLTVDINSAYDTNNSLVNGSLFFAPNITMFALGGLAGTQPLYTADGDGLAVGLFVGGNNTDTTYSGVLSGGGFIAKVGAGNWTLSGVNNYGGQIGIGGGMLTMGNAQALGITDTYSIPLENGGCLNLNGYSSGTTNSEENRTSKNLARLITIDQTGGLANTNTEYTSTYSGVISDATPGTPGSLTKYGAGTLILSGPNTYTGATIINEGTLKLGAAHVLGSPYSANITLNGGTLDFWGWSTPGCGGWDSTDLSRAITITTAGGGLSNTDTNNAVMYTPNITAHADFTVDTPDSLIDLRGAVACPSPVADNWPQLIKTGTGGLFLSGIANNTNLTVNAVQGTVVLNKTSSASVHSAVAVAVGPGATVNYCATGGDYQIQQDNGAWLNLYGGTVNFNGANQIGTPLTVLAGSTDSKITNTSTTESTYSPSSAEIRANLTVDTPNAANSIVLSGGLVCPAPLTDNWPHLIKTGSGTLRLTGNSNNANLTLQADAGTVILNKNTGAYAACAASIGSTATVQYRGYGDQIQPNGSWVHLNGGTLDFNGLSQTGTALTVIAGSSGSTLANTAAGTNSTYSPSSATLDANLTVNAVGNLAINGPISGAGMLTKTGKGLLTLGGATNNYSGGTTISAGNLRFSGNCGVADRTIAISSGAALVADGASYGTAQAWLNGNKITTGSAGALALAGNTSGIIMTGYNSLSIGSIYEPTNGGYTLSGSITPGTGGYRFGGGGGTLTVTSSLSGSTRKLYVNGNVVLSGTNGYGGGTDVNAGGTLRFGSAVPTSNTTRIYSGGTLLATGPWSVVSDWLNMDRGRINTSSAGTLALTTNTYTNNISMGNYSSLSIGANGNCDFSGTMSTNGSAYRLGGGGGTLTVSTQNALSGAKQLSVNGNVNITNSNNYSGATTVNSGTLTLGGSGSISSSSSITLMSSGTLLQNSSTELNRTLTFSGGTLGGQGQYTGNINMGSSSGHLSPGATGVGSIGTLTIGGTGNVTLGSTSVLDFDFGTTSGSCDLLAMTGTSRTLVLNGTLNITNSGGVARGDYTIISGFSNYSGSLSFGSLPAGHNWSMAITDVGSYHNLVITAAPEPGTIVLLATGLLGLLAYAWRKRR